MVTSTNFYVCCIIIVIKKINVFFRTDTDDSSFFPHASSSRRFSSDIFNEQQSQDSFFVTKNKTESINPASLGVIPEVTQANITDITPSGDLKEFDNTEGRKN